MQNRNIALAIVFSIITCGIYQIYWYIMLTDELNIAVGREDTSGGMAFLFSLITCGIYTIYWSYKMGDKLNEAKAQRGYNADSANPVLYLLLTLFGFQIITCALIQDGMNKLCNA